MDFDEYLKRLQEQQATFSKLVENTSFKQIYDSFSNMFVQPQFAYGEAVESMDGTLQNIYTELLHDDKNEHLGFKESSMSFIKVALNVIGYLKEDNLSMVDY